ncbi:MAG: pyridoxal-phosphate dependent enzyme, partial [Thermomicrobiales bacterium]|nr:pyridoxal-phosphate dependent enzyme [Thermomicrobiales bacterium]
MADVLQAREVIATYLQPTPLLNSSSLDARLGFSAFVKCENLQPIGAFKVRGGLVAMKRRKDQGLTKGVITATRGNHGQ